jgi:hypothetical protein
MNNDKPYWFPAKPYGSGVGWGFPLTWQGWVVFAGYFGGIVAAAIFLAPRNGIAFFITVAFLSLALVAICILKGEPQHRRDQLK